MGDEVIHVAIKATNKSRLLNQISIEVLISGRQMETSS